MREYPKFGENLLEVEIKKGVEAHPSDKIGLVRTLDIFVRVKNRGKDNLKHKTEGLKIRLKQGSLNLLPFRIFIKD